MRIRRSGRLGLGLGLGFAAAIVSAAWASLPPQPAKVLDTNRFVGRWYEVARMPNKIQSDCATSLADWAHDGASQFQVIQTCPCGYAHRPNQVCGFGPDYRSGDQRQVPHELLRRPDQPGLLGAGPQPMTTAGSSFPPPTRISLDLLPSPGHCAGAEGGDGGTGPAMGYQVANLIYDQPGS